MRFCSNCKATWEEDKDIFKTKSYREEYAKPAIPLDIFTIMETKFTFEDISCAISMAYHHGLKATGMDGKIKRKIIEKLIKKKA